MFKRYYLFAYPTAKYNEQSEDQEARSIYLQYKSFDQSMETFLKTLQTLKKLYKKGDKDGVQAIAKGEWKTIEENILPALTYFASLWDNKGAMAQIKSEETGKINMLITIGLLILSVFSLIFVYFYFSRKLVKPLDKVCTELEHNAEEISSTSVKLDSNGHDLSDSSGKQAAATQESVAAMEEMLVITPPPCSSIAGRTAFQVRNMLLRLTAITRSHVSSSVSTGPPTTTIPTLLCRMSMRP